MEGVRSVSPSRAVPIRLSEGEEVVYRGRLHRVIFAGPLLAVIANLCVVRSVADSDLRRLAALWTTMACLWLIYSIVNYMISELIVTSSRLGIHVGLLGRRSMEMTLSQIEQISIKQGLLGEFLGYGAIALTAAGGREERFHRIAFPIELKKKVLERMFAERGSREEDVYDDCEN